MQQSWISLGNIYIIYTDGIKLSPPPFSKNSAYKRGGGDLVRDRRPPRKFAKNPRKMQLFHENWPKIPVNRFIKGGGLSARQVA